jgi:hypothetical protein
MKMNLLQMVQNILSDMDSEEVNSVSDTNEAEQIAEVLEATYNNMVSSRFIPEHSQTIKLVSLSDSTRPTHFKFPERVKKVEFLDYNTSTIAGGVSYTRMNYLSPYDFFDLVDKRDSETSSTTKVTDVYDGTILLIKNDGMPTCFTSLDDDHVILDAYSSSVESTLQASKTRAYGVKIPTFNKTSDTFIPDIDDIMFPYLLAEAKSTAMSLFKSGSDPKIEQAARRHKSYLQNDMYKLNVGKSRNAYGRR